MLIGTSFEVLTQSLETLLAYRVAAVKRADLAAALKLDDALEDLGIHADDRITCYRCQSWADDDHRHWLFS